MLQRAVSSAHSLIDDRIFTPAAVAKHLRLPLGSVRWWTLGNAAHPPPIRIADPAEHLMSFRNLVEVHVLQAVMGQDKNHVPLAVVRAVVSGLTEQLGSPHPLSHAGMLTIGKDVVAAGLGALAYGPVQGERKLAAALSLHLSRIERDPGGEPVRLHLFTRGHGGPGHVVIDPAVQRGEPCVSDSDVTTESVARRFTAGESVAELARSTGRAVAELEEAIRYELEEE
jgi:uncharacterized protein (DUF433 family)